MMLGPRTTAAELSSFAVESSAAELSSFAVEGCVPRKGIDVEYEEILKIILHFIL